MPSWGQLPELSEGAAGRERLEGGAASPGGVLPGVAPAASGSRCPGGSPAARLSGAWRAELRFVAGAAVPRPLGSTAPASAVSRAEDWVSSSAGARLTAATAGVSRAAAAKGWWRDLPPGDGGAAPSPGDDPAARCMLGRTRGNAVGALAAAAKLKACGNRGGADTVAVIAAGDHLEAARPGATELDICAACPAMLYVSATPPYAG